MSNENKDDHDDVLPLAQALIQIRRSIEEANTHRKEGGPRPAFIATSIELELQIAATNEKSSEGKGGLNFSVLGLGFKADGTKSAKLAEANTHILRIKFCPIIGESEDGNYAILHGNQELEVSKSSPLVTIQHDETLAGRSDSYIGGETSVGYTGGVSTDTLP